MHKLGPKHFLSSMFRHVNKILNGELVNITQGSSVIIAAYSQGL